mgnify:FL=1
MFEAIFTIFALIGTAYAAIFLIVALCTFFYLGSKQLFGDDNEK